MYRIDVVIPAEIRVPTHKLTYFYESKNEELLAAVVDLAEEKRLLTILKIVEYQ